MALYSADLVAMYVFQMGENNYFLGDKQTRCLKIVHEMIEEYLDVEEIRVALM